jgi:hypothetical protein
MNKKMLNTALLLGGLMAASVALADDGPLTPFRADYALMRNSVGLGVSSFTLEREGASYVYKSSAHASGFISLFISSTITQTSKFELTAGRPRSISYSYSDTGKAADAETIQFDWDKRVATTEENAQKRDKPLTLNTCDVQLIQLMLASDLAAGKVAERYRLLDHGQITPYETHTQPDTQLKLGSKSYVTKVVELYSAERGRTITVWLAPALHYLPVQISQAQTDKATITLSLQAASFEAPAAGTK